MGRLFPYVVVFGAHYFVYMDEVRTRMFPWASDTRTNMGEQITLLRADGIAMVMCIILTIIMVHMIRHAVTTYYRNKGL